MNTSRAPKESAADAGTSPPFPVLFWKYISSWRKSPDPAEPSGAAELLFRIPPKLLPIACSSLALLLFLLIFTGAPILLLVLVLLALLATGLIGALKWVDIFVYDEHSRRKVNNESKQKIALEAFGTVAVGSVLLVVEILFQIDISRRDQRLQDRLAMESTIAADLRATREFAILQERSDDNFIIKLNGVNLTSQPLIGLDLRGADLSNATLVDTRIDGLRLDRATLNGANFRLAETFAGTVLDDVRASDDPVNFDDAVLRRTRMLGAEFQGGSFIRTDFQGSIAQDAKFNGSSLDGSDFRGVDISGADFRGADLGSAKFVGACYIEGRKPMFDDRPDGLVEVAFEDVSFVLEEQIINCPAN